MTAWSHGGNGTIFETESRNRTIFFYEGKGRDSNELANLEMGSRHFEAR